jgi:hypothetical protein
MKYLYYLILLVIPISQHYALQPNTPIWFCIPDELGWTRGNVIYLWGYYPMIRSEYPLKDFNDVVWEVAYE